MTTTLAPLDNTLPSCPMTTVEYDPDWDYRVHDRNGRIAPDAPVRCAACNRPVAGPACPIVLATSGLLVQYTDAHRAMYGVAYLGPECARAVPAEYRGAAC